MQFLCLAGGRGDRTGEHQVHFLEAVCENVVLISRQSAVTLLFRGKGILPELYRGTTLAM